MEGRGQPWALFVPQGTFHLFLKWGFVLAQNLLTWLSWLARDTRGPPVSLPSTGITPLCTPLCLASLEVLGIELKSSGLNGKGFAD